MRRCWSVTASRKVRSRDTIRASTDGPVIIHPLAKADAGFFDDKLLSFLEQRLLPYMVVARLTPWVKRAAQRVEQWTMLNDDYAVGEFRIQLHGWSTQRRLVVISEQVREGRDSVGRRLIAVPGYTFRVFITSCGDPPQ
jgi:hypothetical protein